MRCRACRLGQIEEVLVEHAAHPVASAVDMRDLGESARFEHDADDALVDDRGRATALRDKSFSGQLGHFFLRLLGAAWELTGRQQ
jgi:hypothetical protein